MEREECCPFEKFLLLKGLVKIQFVPEIRHFFSTIQ